MRLAILFACADTFYVLIGGRHFKRRSAARRGRNQKRGMAILAMNTTGRMPVPRRVWGPAALVRGRALRRAQNVCQENKNLRYCNAELFRFVELLCGFHHLTTLSKFYYLFANLLLLI